MIENDITNTSEDKTGTKAKDSGYVRNFYIYQDHLLIIGMIQTLSIINTIQDDETMISSPFSFKMSTGNSEPLLL